MDILELGNMELVFALVTYMGINKIDVSYFRSIDDCKYYAERLNNQPPVFVIMNETNQDMLQSVNQRRLI